MAALKMLRASRDRAFTDTFTWKTSAGAVVDLTGYTARVHLRASTTARDPDLVLSTTNGGIALGGTAGTITLTIDAATMATLAPPGGQAQFRYEVELIPPFGPPHDLLVGPFLVGSSMTRDT